jgi:two-component system chemotaxis response regulator CheY
MDGSARGEPRVLITDDSVVARQVIAMTCRQIPNLLYAQIDQAADGAAALDLLRERRYDLVLADVRMPRMDGIELVRRIRQELGEMTVPVILISTLGTEEDVRRGLEVGATAYLVKPLSPYRIKRLIEQLLSRR